MSGHVIYESRLELTRLLYADFDRGTEAVLAQPFLLSARVDGGKGRHVPDFLILRRGRVPLVADVKPRHLLTRPKVAFSLGWAREAVESRGWEFEAWSEPPEAELANVRFPGRLPAGLAVRPGAGGGDPQRGPGRCHAGRGVPRVSAPARGTGAGRRAAPCCGRSTW